MPAASASVARRIRTIPRARRASRLSAVVSARRRDRSAFEAARLDPRARQDRAQVGDRRQRARTSGRPPNAANASAGAAPSSRSSRGQHLEQAFPEARRPLEIAHAALVLPSLASSAALAIASAIPPKPSTRPELAGGAAVPHPPLGDLVDVGGRLVARLGDDPEEVAIDRFDRRLDQAVGLGRGAL